MSNSEVSDLSKFGTNVEAAGAQRESPCDAIAVPSLKGAQGSLGSGDEYFTQYTKSGKMFLPVNKTCATLPAGAYEIRRITEQGQPVYDPMVLKFDDIMEFKDSQSDQIYAEAEKFWKSGAAFSKWGFLHRRGLFLWGPPGSGKTIIVQQVMRSTINDGGVVFVVKRPGALTLAAQAFRAIEPVRKLVCVFEDIDAICREYGEEDLLSALDGETQIDHVLNIATTNFPERVSRRIISRPRRFDKILFVDNPPEHIRREYLMRKMKLSASDAAAWSKRSEGLSFAALAELVVGVKCLGGDLESVIDRLQEQYNSTVSSEKYENRRSKKTGFAT